MQPEEQLGVLVLAAGAGRRLGCDKAGLSWGSTTLVGHVVEQFALSCVRQRVVVVNPRNNSAVRQALPDDVEIVVNPEPRAEMITSVRMGIRALSVPQGAVCIHPVDVFGVSRELVIMLWRASRANPDRIHLPEVAGRGGHPLIVPACLVAEIERIPPGYGLNWLLHEHAEAVVHHAWHDERLLVDIDTLEDYRRWRPKIGRPEGGAIKDPNPRAGG